VGVAEGSGVTVGVGVIDGVGVTVGVAVGRGVGVAVGVTVGVAVAVGVGVGVGMLRQAMPRPTSSDIKPSNSKPEKVQPKLRTVCDTMTPG
jgi:hypothetical protein